MDFLQPRILWLLAIVPVLLIWQARRGGLRGITPMIAGLLRAMALIALIVALARPVIERPDRTRTSVAIVDVSASMSDADLDAVQKDLTSRRLDGRTRLVVFDETAREVEWAQGSTPRFTALRSPARSATQPAGRGSALADAIDLGAALVRRDGAGSVRLYTDGMQTRGDARAAAHRLAQRHLPLEVVPIGATRRNEVVLRTLQADAQTAIGATLDLSLEVEAEREATARIIVTPPSGAAITRNVTLRAGVQTMHVPVPVDAEGVQAWTVRIDAPADAIADNNALAVSSRAGGPYTVRVIADAGSGAPAVLSRMLTPVARVTAGTPADLDGNLTRSSADLLALVDVPATEIAPEAQVAIHRAVLDGMGLLIAGGRRAYGPGGYIDGPLAEMLPVRAAQKLERRDPSTTLVVIIDTSGSMGGPRVDLAKEIARLALARLTPQDKAGIVEFYGSKRWAAPIQPASNAIDLQRALNRLSSSGGTVILPAIEEAYYALLNVRTRTRHVLVLTDGGVETGAFEAIIRKMADAGMTLSTVMVGPGTHSAFLSSLAQWGRGRFYSAPDRFNLPEVIVKQPETALLSPFIEQASRIAAGPAAATWLADVDVATAPSLAGYVETEPRPSADLLLVSEAGHPIFARWRFGLGGVAAFTSQIGGAWSSDFAGWPGAARTFANVCRSLLTARSGQELRISPRVRGEGLEIRIENQAVARGGSLAPLEVTLTRAGTAPIVRTLDPIRADEWNLYLPRLGEGTYEVTAKTGDAALAGSAAVSIPPQREVTHVAGNEALLAELRRIASATPAGRVAPPPTLPRELWPELVMGVWVLVLANILLRRWPGAASQVARVGASRAAMIAAILVTCCLVRPARAQSAPATSSAPATQPVDLPPLDLPAPALDALHAALIAPQSSDADAHYERAERITLEQLGTWQPIITALKTQAQTPRGSWLLARAATQAGQLAIARDALQSLIDNGTRDERVWAEWSRIHELMGDDDAALEAIGAALQHVTTPELKVALRVRQALLLYDKPDPAAAGAILKEVSASSIAAAEFCGLLAGINGDSPLALELLPTGGEMGFREYLFRGLFQLRVNRPDQARLLFEQAYARAPLERDRRFALERIMTAARQAGQLGTLADQWIADTGATPDRLIALVSMLRELGRSDDALTLLQRGASTPEQQKFMDSPEFQQELIAVAASTGRAAAAETAYRRLLQRSPHQVEVRVGLARLQLLDGRRDDAVASLREGIARAETSSSLMALADGARKLALDDIALEAAGKSAGLGRIESIRAGLFEADLLRQRAQSDKALALLRRLAARPDNDPASRQLIAEAFERYGDKTEALKLLREVYAQTPAEDTLLHIAWLLEEAKRFDEAFSLWRDMWETTKVAARLKQAQARMLKIASDTGRLADLAIAIEEKIDKGEATDRELTLLIDLYTTASDPVSASEILQDYARRTGRQVEMLQKLARVYLACEQFGRCNAALRQLVQADPANASDYLQQIAMVAIERQQPQEAREAIAQLATFAGGSEIADELSAGVLHLLKLHGEAARSYGRVLGRHPDRIESLLLWGNAMRDAGLTDQAVAHFQVLVEDAAEDDLFTVCVDGLLNLQARPAALKSALRRVLSRIAAAPQKVFLYQLAADLMEGATTRQRGEDLMELCVAVGGERRGPMLRELMESARGDGHMDDMIRFGSSLMALGDEVPPQVLLDLGEALIKMGRLSQAEQVFARAAVAGDYVGIQQRVAGYYEAANMPGDADRIIRELLINEPDNVQLLIRSGTLGEQLGAFEGAFAQYYRAADLMLRRIPGTLAEETTSQPSSTRGATRTVRSRQATNLDEMSRFFEAAQNGLLNAARTPQLRERLLKDASARFDQELDALDKARGFAAAIDRNPRLAGLSRFVRQVAFSLSQPDLADAADQRLLQKYPKDATLRPALVASRIEWGLTDRAMALADAQTVENSLDLTIRGYMSDAAKLKAALAAGQIAPDVAEKLVPRLIMQGRSDEARQVLASATLAPVRAMGDVAAGLIAASIALEDHAAMMRWFDYWLAAAQKGLPQLLQYRTSFESEDALPRPGNIRRGPAIARSLERCVRVTWNHLTDPERQQLVSRVESIAGTLDEDDRTDIHLLRMRLGEATGMPFGGVEALVTSVAANPDGSTDTLLKLIEAFPADRQAELLRTSITAQKPPTQRSRVLTLAGRIDRPLEEATIATLVDLFKAAPPQRIEKGRGYNTLRGTGWASNKNCPELAGRLAEVLIGELPEEPAVLTCLATARVNAGKYDEAVSPIREALEAILAVKKAEYDHRGMLEDLCGLLQPPDLEKTLNDLVERMSLEEPTPIMWYARGELCTRLDRQADARAAYRAAFELAPNESFFNRRLITTMRASGRIADLAEALSANLTKSTIMESYQWRMLLEAYIDLYRLDDATRAARRSESPLAPVDCIHVARLRGNVDEARTTLRRFLAANRDDARFYTPFWPADPSPMGMLGYFEEQRVRPWQRPRLMEAIADLPFAEEEFRSLLLAAPPSRKDVPGMIDGLRRATGINHTRDGWLAELAQRFQKKAFTERDRLALISLAQVDASSVPASLLPAVMEMLIDADPLDAARLTAIAKILAAQKQTEAARRVLTWATAADLANGRGYSRMNDRFARLDLLVSLMGDAPAQKTAALRFMHQLDPTPVDEISDELDPQWLERLDRLDASAGETAAKTLADRLAKDRTGGRRRDVRAALARFAARRGQMPEFEKHARGVLLAPPSDLVTDAQIDPRILLPSATETPNAKACLDVAVRCLAEAVEQGTMRKPMRIRCLSLLAHWCAEQKLADEGTALLTQARENMDQPGDHWLWVADAARALGDDAGADAIEVKALREKILPVVRLPGLLERVNAGSPRQASDLALLASGWTDHPLVLHRALAAARSANDAAKAADLSRRLAGAGSTPSSAPASPPAQ